MQPTPSSSKRRRLSEEDVDERPTVRRATSDESRRTPDQPSHSPAAEFLSRYAAGAFDSRSTPSRPAGFEHEPAAFQADEEAAEPSGRLALAKGQIEELPENEQLADSYTRFYRVNGFIPAPIASSELARRSTSDYDFLYTPVQRQAVDRIVKLARTFFAADAAFASVPHGGEMHVLSADGDAVGPFGSMTSFDARFAVCTHSMLSTEDRIFEVSDMTEDWRFAGNPAVTTTQLKSYAGFPIRMRRSGSRTGGTDDSLCVGNICVCSYRPQPPMTDEQVGVLKTMAEMISHELEADADNRVREQQAVRHDYVARLIAAVLVRSELSGAAGPTVEECLRRAATDLRDMLGADAVVMVDLRSVANQTIDISTSHSDSSGTETVPVIFGGSDSPAVVSALMTADARAALRELVQHHASTGQTSYDVKAHDSPPLFKLLPSDTRSTLAIPLSSPDGKPVLLVLATSNSTVRRFSSSDAAFAEAVGAVCLARIVHDRLRQVTTQQSHINELMSHELRQPIHVIVGQLELIRDVCTSALPSDVAQNIETMLDTARTCADGLREVLEDTLTYGSLNSADLLELESNGRKIVETDVAQLVQDTVASAVERRKQQEATARERRQPVDVSVVIEDSPTGWQVHVDAAGMIAVLRAVVLNAIQYTTAGSVTVTLNSPADDHISLTVADTGIGMPQGFVENRQLFAPFVQADPFSPGAGLGLAICESLLEKMKGEISVESQVGQGTTVSLSIPISTIEATPLARAPSIESIRSQESGSGAKLTRVLSLPATTTSPTAGSTADPSPTLTSVERLAVSEAPSLSTGDSISSSTDLPWDQQPLRVLVADDNSTARRILTTLLARKGIEYRDVEDGQQAVDLFKLWRPHVFWTDISMPVLDGLQAAAQIRSYEAACGLPPCRIVAVTAARELDSQHLQRASLDEYHVKGSNVLPSLAAGLEALRAGRKTPIATAAAVAA